jgi:hypothetical protein
MAKLNKKTATMVDKAESGSFEPLEAGAYHVRLVDVDADREGPKGPYWSWEFDVVEEGGRGKLWQNTSLSEAAAFKMKETFDAFGVPADTDTDDLCGKVVKAIVSVRTIQQGARQGELANQIDRLVPADDDFEAPVAAGTGLSESEDIFAD